MPTMRSQKRPDPMVKNGFVWGIHVLRVNTHYLTKLECINITSMATLPANEQLWNIHHESRSFPRKTNHVLSLKNISQLGLYTIPNIWKKMLQTTNQIMYFHGFVFKFTHVTVIPPRRIFRPGRLGSDLPPPSAWTSI